jgi:RimJ/RimL family protein N-acetyltransferase
VTGRVVNVMPSRTIDPCIAIVLRDGRPVVLGPLTGADSAALVAAVAHADAVDLRRRFMGPPPTAVALTRLLRHADGVHDMLLGAFDCRGRLVGVAQFDRRDDEPVAEFAIEIAKDWQRCGLGAVMLRRLGAIAERQGVSRFTVVYVADNTAIIRLMRSTGATTWTGTECGVSSAELALDCLQ